MLIFIRNPVLGAVKTRLARTLGVAEALRIYHVLLVKTRNYAAGVVAERHLYYSEFIEDKDDWPRALFEKKCQVEGDLGARMEAAFRTAFESGAGKVLIIGSDCPELSSGLLNSKTPEGWPSGVLILAV